MSRSVLLWLLVSLPAAAFAQARGEFASSDKLLEAVDAALCAAKEAGRNRVAGFHDRRADDVPAAAREVSDTH
jgi:hypothetical protein